MKNKKGHACPPRRINRQAGFSLIELIVVITIIAVITAVGVISFAGAGKKARDGKRISDLEKIRVALEIYKQTVGTYPAVSGSSVDVLVPNYIQSWPSDPRNGANYYYESTLSGYGYNLYAHLENPPTTDMYSYNCGSGYTYNTTSVGKIYAVGGPLPVTPPSSTIPCNYKVTNP